MRRVDVIAPLAALMACSSAGTAPDAGPFDARDAGALDAPGADARAPDALADSDRDGSEADASPADAEPADAEPADSLADPDAEASDRGAIPPPPPPTPACRFGWCWRVPLPQGNALSSVSGATPTEVWSVGDVGTALRFDGQSWGLVETGVLTDLRGVWVSSATCAWAVGAGGSILRWDGAQWSPDLTPTTMELTAVWGSSARDVWAVGRAGTVAHFDGRAWALVPGVASGDLRKVEGTGPADVWITGSSGAVHFDGTSWQAAPLGRPVPTWFGREGYPYDYAWAPDGTVFAIVQSHDIGARFLYALYEWTGAVWLARTSGFVAVRALHADDRAVWLVGPRGQITAWNRVAAREETWGGAPTAQLSHAYASRSSDDVWAAGWNPDAETFFGGVAHWSGSGWAEHRSIDPRTFSSIWGWGASEAWALRESMAQLAHFDGATWTDVAAVPGARALWGASPTDLIVVGDGALFRVNGATMALTPTTASSLHAVWGSSAADVWAAGEDGLVVHWDGATLTPRHLAHGRDTVAIHGSGPDDVWAVGASAAHWDGQAWTVSPLGISARSVFVESSTRAWVSANGGRVARWDGAAWAVLDTPTREDLLHVSGSTVAGDVCVFDARNGVLCRQ